MPVRGVSSCSPFRQCHSLSWRRPLPGLKRWQPGCDCCASRDVALTSTRVWFAEWRDQAWPCAAWQYGGRNAFWLSINRYLRRIGNLPLFRQSDPEEIDCVLLPAVGKSERGDTLFQKSDLPFSQIASSPVIQAHLFGYRSVRCRLVLARASAKR